MIQHIICPDKIWDLKYNKNNKLLRKYEKCTIDYNLKNIISKRLKRIHFKYARTTCYTNRNIYYLFITILLCYCIMMIAATPHSININNSNISLDNNNNNNNFSLSNSNIEYDNNKNNNNNAVRNSNKNYNNNNNSNSFNIKNNNNKDNKNNYNNNVKIYDKTHNNHLSNRNRIQKRKLLEASNMPDTDDEYFDDEDDELSDITSNKSAKGMYIGAPCDVTCHPKLHHVYCDQNTFTCMCDRNYPVIIEETRGCAKPKKLGEQCFYHQTCEYNDIHSLCVQISHNALCQCSDGFHSVSYLKPTKRVFCTQDIAVLTADLPTLLGVTSGIAVLAGLICMVLHLFSKTKYPRHRNFADANIPPPIMYSSDTGIPLTVQSGRPSSRSSLRSSGSFGSYGNRRPSSAPQSGSKGVIVSASRTGSRRPSLASIQSTSSSVRSYSIMRFEKEVQQKELRQEMKLRLSRLQQQQHYSQNRPQIIVGDTILSHTGTISKIITPSPLTPNSTDELLPSVDEAQEYSPKLSARNDAQHDAAYHGPCTSSSEYL